MYASSKRASQHYGVTNTTLRRWAKEGRIATLPTVGGHNRYSLAGVTPNDNPAPKVQDRIVVAYARVSSTKQTQDLQRQIEFLTNKYSPDKVYSDVASSLRHSRRGYLRLLEDIASGKVQKILATHRDRITRFNWDMFEWLCTRFNVEIHIDESEHPKPAPEELAYDIIAVMHSFSGKYYGRRAKKHETHT